MKSGREGAVGFDFGARRMTTVNSRTIGSKNGYITFIIRLDPKLLNIHPSNRRVLT